MSINNKHIQIILFTLVFAVFPAALSYSKVESRKEPQNIAMDFLDMEKPLGAGKVHYERVNVLITKAKEKITAQSDYTNESALKTMKDIASLLKEEGFIFKNNLLLSKGIELKAIDCDNYCALYIAIAETLKIPIVPVYAPNHSFLRFYFNDGSYLNWEPIKATSLSDDYYIKALCVSQMSVNKGVYMKTLSRKEFTGVQYNNIGAYLMTGKKFSEAIPYLNMAIACYPNFSSAYHNRGTCLYATKRLKNASDDLLMACGLDPNRSSTRNTLGDIYFDSREYDKALEQYRISIKLDPDNSIPYYSIGLILKITGNDVESKKWLKKSEALKNKRK